MNRPKALVCYICGREFGTKSLAIHLKACEKKWENQENLKPPKERRPCPRAPQGMATFLEKGNISGNDINAFNAKNHDTFVEQALIECEYCTRKFLPKSLVPHQKACKINPMIKKPYQNKGPLGKASQIEQPLKPATGVYSMKQDMGGNEGGNLVPCRRCGRTFMGDRIAKHERVCKADPVQLQKKAPQKIESKPQATKFKPNFAKQKKAKWKIQHQQLQNAMKAMRQIKSYEAKGGKLSDLPPPAPSNYDHYVQCRHCGRKYAADVAERHIPKCANIINKPGGIKPSKIQEKYIAGTGSGISKTYVQPISTNINTPLKPNFSTNNHGVKGSGMSMGSKNPSKVEQPTSPFSNPFGNGYKPTTNKQIKPTPTYQPKPDLSKPGMKGGSRSNANKYW